MEILFLFMILMLISGVGVKSNVSDEKQSVYNIYLLNVYT